MDASNILASPNSVITNSMGATVEELSVVSKAGGVLLMFVLAVMLRS